MYNSNIKISPKTIKDYANSFVLKNDYFWHSEAEEKVYKILKEELDEHYIIFPHVAFTDIFDIKNDSDDISKKLRNCVSKYHFDFVIYDAKLFLPVLLIEINGRTHTEEYKKNIDIFKEKLFSDMKGTETELNLIQIDLFEKVPDDELREIIINIINVPRNRYRAYCSNCQNPLTYKYSKKIKKFFYFCNICKNEKNTKKNKTFNEIDIPSLHKTKNQQKEN